MLVVLHMEYYQLGKLLILSLSCNKVGKFIMLCRQSRWLTLPYIRLRLLSLNSCTGISPMDNTSLIVVDELTLATLVSEGYPELCFIFQLVSLSQLRSLTNCYISLYRRDYVTYLYIIGSLPFRFKGLSPTSYGPTPVALCLTTRAYGIVSELTSYRSLYLEASLPRLPIFYNVITSLTTSITGVSIILYFQV